MGTYGQFLTRKAQGSGDKRLKPGVKQNLPSLPTSPKKETSTEAVGASITNGAFANGHGQLTRVDAAGNKDVPVVNNGKTKDNIPVATSGEAVDTSDTPTEVPTVPSGTGDTKVPTGTWNDDGSQFTTGDGLIWTPDEYGILYADIDGQKVTWGSYYEGTAAPVYTSAETESGGYDGYLSSYPSYEEYLTGAGAEIQGAYSKAVQNAKQEYAMNRATYGARGEQLGRAGLTGSGYGDYLEGAAYSAMQGAISQAELGRAQSYAAYLTEQQQSAASYAAYLTQKEEQDAADRSSYINGTLYQYALSNSSLTAEDLMRWANGLDPSLGGKSHNLTYAEAEKLLTSAATQRKMNGTDAAFIDNLAYGVAYDGDGNLLTMKTEEEYRRLLAYWELSEEEMQSVLNKIQQHYGMTFEEGAAENDAATADTKTYNAMLTHLQNGGTERTEADLITKIREIDPSISDERAANIAEQLLPVVAEMDAEQNTYNTEAIAIMTENYESFDDADALRLYLQGKNYNDAAINAAIDEYYKWNEHYISKSIGNMNVSELTSWYSLAQLQGMVGKSISEEQMSTIQTLVSERLAELFNQAYESGDASAVANLLGVTFGESTTDFGGEIAKAAYAAFSSGVFTDAQLGNVLDRFVEDNLANLGSESGAAVELAQLAGSLTDIIGDDEDLAEMYDGYMDRLAEMVNIGPDGKGYINGKYGFDFAIYMAITPEKPIEGVPKIEGSIYIQDGKFYKCFMYNGELEWLRAYVEIPDSTKELEEGLSALIMRNREDGVIDSSVEAKGIASHHTPLAGVINKYSGYGGYLTGGK